jgi:hypothetical protein
MAASSDYLKGQWSIDVNWFTPDLDLPVRLMEQASQIAINAFETDFPSQLFEHCQSPMRCWHLVHALVSATIRTKSTKTSTPLRSGGPSSRFALPGRFVLAALNLGAGSLPIGHTRKWTRPDRPYGSSAHVSNPNGRNRLRTTSFALSVTSGIVLQVAASW